MNEVECVVWCPDCGVDKFAVSRVSTGAEGVYENKITPPQAEAKYCDVCGEPLARKP